MKYNFFKNKKIKPSKVLIRNSPRNIRLAKQVPHFSSKPKIKLNQINRSLDFGLDLTPKPQKTKLNEGRIVTKVRKRRIVTKPLQNLKRKSAYIMKRIKRVNVI